MDANTHLGQGCALLNPVGEHHLFGPCLDIILNIVLLAENSLLSEPACPSVKWG